MKITFENQTIELSAKMTGNGINNPWGKSQYNTFHNKFKVKISTDIATRYFDFYGSHKDWENGVKELDEEALTDAFYYFLSDALSADQSFEDFCSELGYDEDSRKAYKIYKTCGKSLDKARTIIPVDLYELANHLQEEYSV